MRFFRPFILFAVLLGMVKESAYADGPIAVEMSPSPYNSNLLITFLQDQYIRANEPLVVRTRSFRMGEPSNSNPALQVVQRKNRLSDIICFIDGRPAFVYNYTDGVPFIESRRYFHFTAQKKLSNIKGLSIAPGPHAAVAALRNSYGETIKTPSAIDVMVFSYRKKAPKAELEAMGKKLEKPLILYNEPVGTFKSGQPVLLDFVVLNCVLASKGYAVDVYVDQQKVTSLNQWAPYFLKNLSSGKHKVSLELVSPSGDVVDNPFGVAVEGEFQVE